jgi:hypothetical protein
LIAHHGAGVDSSKRNARNKRAVKPARKTSRRRPWSAGNCGPEGIKAGRTTGSAHLSRARNEFHRLIRIRPDTSLPGSRRAVEVLSVSWLGPARDGSRNPR